MCIIVHIPAGSEVTDDILRNCFDNNPDGAGFAVKDKDTSLLTIKKGFFDFDSFLEAYNPYKGNELLLHFRIKTHGNIDIANTHPFSINDQLAFVHNGVINNVSTRDKNFSDTWHFNEDIIKPLVKKFGNGIIDSPEIQMLITEFIGYSKLVFIQEGDNPTWIFNKKAGDIVDDVWFSNNTYKTSKFKYSYPKAPFSDGLDRDNYYDTKKNDYYSYWNYIPGTIVEIITDNLSFCEKGEYGTIIEVIDTSIYKISIYSQKNNWTNEIVGTVSSWQIKRA